MSMSRLAFQNFKSGLKNYLSLIVSLAFTVMIFFNFQNIIYSDALASLGEHNKDYSDMLVQVLSVVLGVFLFFFIGYATNVFLTSRKKEIGVYVFMGLTNQRIGRLYTLEMTWVGIVTVAVGIGSGILTTKLFQMILLALSDAEAKIGFHISLEPMLITTLFYLAVYMFFVLKGYVNIVRSSILDLVSASRQNEYVRQKRPVLLMKTALGLGTITAGYYVAVKEGGMEVMQHLLLAVVLVIVGIYFLFGGCIPMLFQGLAKNKHFLYCRERNLWVNQLIFRMKKNYRTYAMVCILMLCSVTALATSFAIKGRYENIVHFRNTYTFQLLSDQSDLKEKAAALIGQDNEVTVSTSIPILMVDASDVVRQINSGSQYVFLSWSRLQQLAEETGLELDVEEPKDGEVVEVEHMYLMSILTKRSGIKVEIFGREYEQIGAVNEPYLGYLQEQMTYYLLSDAEYEKMLPRGQELYAYNYQIKDPENFKASKRALGTLTSNSEDNHTARIVTDPKSIDEEVGWIKVLYSLGIFMVMVFIMASGSVLFMKLYNDAFEEQERYQTLHKLGCPYRVLKRSVFRELSMAYALPFLVMAVSSYFSVHALEQLMYTDLTAVRLNSIGIIFVFFLLCYRLSVAVYIKNAKIR